MRKKITYWGGKIIDQSNVIDDRKKILLRADSPSSRYFKLCGENERLLERPIVYGGVSRWVEKEKNIMIAPFLISLSCICFRSRLVDGSTDWLLRREGPSSI